ncbi:pirin family protein [Marinobacter excellens]|jgi:redox-sensitive bicupin YhaK (pirin superfamily)|uniref:Pirin-related protein n=1 Tax=Marinobacter excellens LAMA 842 TaxID=1306954 RepID=A0A137S3A9_9GAMM|nr:pirin family protein [Marinobacter excellens]KXO06911.1 Pirin-related protein [Marinobacter excellens LAMA 842]
MSNLSPQTEFDCPITKECGALVQLLQPRERDLGGFSVRRVLPVVGQKMIGPWIFFDHMGPAHFPAGDGINVRPHPHIGIATVTYLFEGEILHRDSLGSLQPIRPGDINLMVAGHGIVHSERERPEITATDHTLHGLQLWLALPEAEEETDPAFYHYPESTVPSVSVGDVPVRVMMGTAYGETSPVKVFADTLYIEAWLKPGQKLTLPDSQERGLYVAKGRLLAGETEIPEFSMAVLSEQQGVIVEALEETRLALIGGEPLGKRFIEWNFVSSRKERIEEAKRDWENSRFPSVPGDEDEYIPLPG